MPGSLSNEEGQDDMDFEDDVPDDDEEGERERNVPLSPLERFFSEDSVKQHKKKKPSKITEGKEEKPKVKKKKKKESLYQGSSALCLSAVVNVPWRGQRGLPSAAKRPAWRQSCSPCSAASDTGSNQCRSNPPPALLPAASLTAQLAKAGRPPVPEPDRL